MEARLISTTHIVHLTQNIRTLDKRKCQYILLSKDKISNKKKEIIRDADIDAGVISANDVIMSAVCELCNSSDIFAFDRSVRGIKDGEL